MAYIGKQPTVGNFIKLDAIVTSATATYNLLNGGVAYSPQSPNHCIVSLNGVIQSPTTSFTISGSTIVFASALTATDVIDFILVLGDVLNIGTPSDATVTNVKLALTAGSAGTPTISPTSDTNTGIFFPAADTIGFAEGGSEVMRIDSSGRVGIGATSLVARLQILEPLDTVVGAQSLSVAGAKSNYVGETALIQNQLCVIDSTYGNAEGQGGAITFAGTTQAAPTTSTFFATIDGVKHNSTSGNYSGKLRFFTRSNGVASMGQRMTIDDSGNVLVGKTTAGATSTAGCEFGTYGAVLTRAAADCLTVNRETKDGTIVSIRQAATEEGTISVSGATVAYNGFTGTHWSRFIDESKPDVLRGTVMESLDQMTDWYHVEFEVSTTEKDADGNDVVKTTTEKKPYALKAGEKEGDVITYDWNTGEIEDYKLKNYIIKQVQATIVKQVDVKHVMSKISDTVEAKNVYGVFSAWDNDDLINNDFYVASVGSYVVRIKAGQTVSKGDLLQSNGDGTAKVQADDIIRASTFAKVLSNTVIQTYEDGSFIVPCSLMC